VHRRVGFEDRCRPGLGNRHAALPLEMTRASARATCLVDRRQEGEVDHTVRDLGAGSQDLPRERVFGIACSYAHHGTTSFVIVRTTPALE
jgi:hypothetical protein